MRIFARLLLLTSVVPLAVIAQTPAQQDLPVGQDYSASPTALSLRWDLPEPVGWVEITLEYVPTDARVVRPDDVRLTGGRITFREHGVVELPYQFLGCIPFPRPRETQLSLVYPEVEGDGDWFADFFSYIDIFYGPRTYNPDRETIESREYPVLRITLKADKLLRAVFTERSGDLYRFEPVPDECSTDLIEWLNL